MSDDNFLLNRLINNGCKVNITAAGCGAYFANLLQTPGISKVLRSMTFLSSADAVNDFIGYTPKHYVSEKTADDIYLAAVKKSYNEAHHIVLTAAIPTIPERRGSNKAYIMIYNGVKSLRCGAISEKDMSRELVDRYFCRTAIRMYLGEI